MWLKLEDPASGMARYHCLRNLQSVYTNKYKRLDREKGACLLKYGVSIYGRSFEFETKAEAEKFLKNLMIAVRFANSGRLNTIVPPYIVTVDELKNMEW